MNTKNVLTIIGIVLILGIGGFVYSQKDNEIKVPNTNTTTQNADNGSTSTVTNSNKWSDDGDDDEGGTAPTQTIPNTTGTTIKSYSKTDVASHSSKASCWSIINGNVYDLTSWIPNHPGGERAILSICGIDGSGAFNGQHGGNSKIVSILAGFKIGVLK